MDGPLTAPRPSRSRLRALIGDDAPDVLDGLRLILTIGSGDDLIDATLYDDAIRPHRIPA